ncbi:hypothetical protein [Pantoea phytobeneficialis]|uniref:Uncharacterized protein n=1 Tax=Pantoea phytobeneficialis TaxID=2052056 RepID=A0AAP9H6E4_9GAMM|nr:hypothetical protein [Pantoea phytobeneficialis]MDO6409549.1 hypothetical protein [Pantoea phytobeneficialis]QGR07371.1 hypothetical protein CTZ24_13475 [Pantoea phytobeneficialis]
MFAPINREMLERMVERYSDKHNPAPLTNLFTNIEQPNTTKLPYIVQISALKPNHKLNDMVMQPKPLLIVLAYNQIVSSLLDMQQKKAAFRAETLLDKKPKWLNSLANHHG